MDLLNSRPVWFTEQVPGQPGLHSETVLKKQNNKKIEKMHRNYNYQTPKLIREEGSKKDRKESRNPSFSLGLWTHVEAPISQQ